MPITIDFLSNTSRLERGTENVEKAFEGVADSLDDIARDGGRTADRLERDFRSIAREASDTGRDIGRKMDDGFDKAKQGADEFKDEANSTAREAAASFDGSAESIGDMFQEIAANAFAGFGPAGALAGLAAAAGIGLAIKGFEDIGIAQEASEQAAADWADSYVEAGGRVLTSAITTARALEIITDTEGRFKEAEENARNWGVSIETAVAAMAGETWALSAAQEALGRRSAEAAQALAEQERQVDSNAGAAYDLGDAVEAGQRSLSKLTGEMDAGAQRADIYSRYLATMAANTAGATREVDEFGDSIYSLPDGTQVYVDAETGQASRNVDDIKNRIYGVNGIRATATIDADTSPATRKIGQLNGQTVYVRVDTQGRRGMPFQ